MSVACPHCGLPILRATTTSGATVTLDAEPSADGTHETWFGRLTPSSPNGKWCARPIGDSEDRTGDAHLRREHQCRHGGQQMGLLA